MHAETVLFTMTMATRLEIMLLIVAIIVLSLATIVAWDYYNLKKNEAEEKAETKSHRHKGHKTLNRP